MALDKFDIKNNLVLEIISAIPDATKLFLFNMVQGHSGVVGNEMADQLAKSAVSLSRHCTQKTHLNKLSYNAAKDNVHWNR